MVQSSVGMKYIVVDKGIHGLDPQQSSHRLMLGVLSLGYSSCQDSRFTFPEVAHIQ